MDVPRRSKVLRLVAAGAAALALLGPAASASAQDHGRWEHHEWRRDAPRWHGDIRHFDRGDFQRWRGGHWVHSRHGGRLGWWWVVGPSWYFYRAPIYPYPDPYIPPVVTVAPPSPTWYYCRSAQAYYPYVGSCPEPWVPVAPQP